MKVLLFLTGAILLVTSTQGIKDSGYGGPSRYGGPHPSYNRGGFHNRGSGYYGGGYGYKKIYCPKLSDPANGSVNVSGLYPGQKAVYSCNDGFQLVGLSRRICQYDGKWSQDAPICKRINCGPLPAIANGAVEIAPDTRLGSIATYSCNSGFILMGEETRECLADGTYSGKEPSCKPIDCESLEDPDNGWVHISPNTLLGAKAVYKCKLGYELSSEEPLMCSEDGEWGTPPTCDAIDCGSQPAANANSQIESTQGTSLRDQTTYSCDDGYFAVGLTTIYCQNDGQYSSSAPVCERVDCGDLSDIPNGSIEISTDSKLGSTATYSCDSGYIREGDETRTCQTNGQWSGSAPSCNPVDCGSLDNPSNGVVAISPNTLFQATAVYDCKLGYVLTGDERRVCQANGEWSSSAPTCEPIDCGTQPEPQENGVLVSTEGTLLRNETEYGCNEGFFTVGTVVIECQKDGKYSCDSPTCERVDCREPDPADPNGAVVFTSTTFESVATYSCNDGFILVGESVSTCQADGTWSSQAPVCQAVDCGKLPAPKNGAVSFYPGTILSSTASFVCKRGFRLVGSQVRTCQTTGKWSGVQPVCKKIQCPKLKPPQYGKVYVSGVYPGDYAVYDCGYGYSLVGKRRRVCQHTGKWTGSASDCVKDKHHYGGEHDSGYGYGSHEY